MCIQSYCYNFFCTNDVTLIFFYSQKSINTCICNNVQSYIKLALYIYSIQNNRYLVCFCRGERGLGKKRERGGLKLHCGSVLWARIDTDAPWWRYQYSAFKDTDQRWMLHRGAVGWLLRSVVHPLGGQ